MISSKKNSKALTILNNKLFKIMNGRCILASYLLSPSFNIVIPEHTSQFKLKIDPNSNNVDDLLITKTIPVTRYDNLLTFRDTLKKFELQGDFLKMITNKNYSIHLAKLSDQKNVWISKQTYFDDKAYGNKSRGEKSLRRLLKSPAIIVFASGVSSSHRKSFLRNKIFIIWSWRIMQ